MNRKTVFITGSSRGIGKAIALKFASEGYQVAINSSNSMDALLESKKEIEALGAPCLALPGDVSDYETVKTMFDQIESRLGTVDVLVNNAGISHIGLFSDMTPDQWERIMAVNLYSVFHCCSRAVPSMVRKQEGKIINISSVWGNVGASCEVIYSASKGGMNSFTKALAKELAVSNIQVNAIACGAIDTEMNQSLDEESMDRLISEIPANRLGKAREVAEFLYDLSKGHNYLTGQIITLDGAWT